MVYELANTPQLHLIDRGYIVVRQEPTDSFGDQKMAEMENVPPQEALGILALAGEDHLRFQTYSNTLFAQIAEPIFKIV